MKEIPLEELAQELHERWLKIRDRLGLKDWEIVKEYLREKRIPIAEGYGTIVEVSFRELLKRILEKPIGVISGFSVLDRDVTQSVNNTKALKRELENRGYEVIYIGGAWKDPELGGVIPELSLLVIGDDPEKLLDDLSRSAKRYNQFAFIFGDGDTIVLYERDSLDKGFFTPTKKFTGYTVMNLKRAIELMHSSQIEGISFYRSKAVLGRTDEPLPSDWVNLFKKYGIKGIRRERIERMIRMSFLKEGKAKYELISPFEVAYRGWIWEMGRGSDKAKELKIMFGV